MADETDIAVIGIKVDSSEVDASTASLDRWLAKGAQVEAMAGRLAALNAASSKGINPAMLGGLGSAPAAGLNAGVDAAAKLTQGIDAVSASATRLEAIMGKLAASNAATFAKINPAMLGTAGPSPVGGSAAHPFGPQWQQSMTGATQGYVGLTKAAEGAADVTERMAAANSAASAKLAAATGVTAADVAARFAHVQASSAMAEAEDVLAGRFGNTTRALGASAAAHKSHGGAVYGNQLQMMELAHVGRALFDEMMAGGNVLRGLAMEFGRLQIAVTSGEGGITGMLGRVAGFAGRLANPMALATGSVVAFGTAAAVSFSRYESGQEELERALNLRGRYSGLTLDSANRLAASSAERGGLSMHEGTSLAASYLGAGLNRDATASAIEMSRDFGRITGKGTEEGGKFLAGALGDPSRGLGELGQLLGGVDDKLKAQIDTLERSGRIYEAQALELGFINRAMHEAGESTFSFSRSLGGAWNWISDRFSGLGHGVADALGYGGDEVNLAKNKALLAQLSTFDPAGNAPEIAALRQEIAKLEAGIGKASADAARREAEGRAIQLSGRAGDAVRTLLPELTRQRNATDTVELLRSALADPLVMGHLDPSISPALLGRAYSQANVLEAMSRPGVRERQDYEMGLSRIRDSGVEDQGLNAARRAELEILRTTGDVIRATSAAQRAYNLELASAQERADDMARTSRQNLDLIGLSPFARAMKEVDQKYLGPRGLIESYSLDKGGANVLSDRDISADLRGGYAILTAGQDAAGKLTAAGGHLVGAVEGVATKLDAAAGRIGPAEAAARLPYGSVDHARAAFGVPGALPTFVAGARAFDTAPPDIQARALDAAARTGQDPGIIAAIGKIENSYRLTGGTTMLGADGRPSSAWGFGQLTDGAARDVAAAVPGFSKYDPATSVFGAAEYLKILVDRNGGNLTAALNAYGGTPDYASKIARVAGGGIPLSAPAAAAAGSTLTVSSREAAVAPIGYTGRQRMTDAFNDARGGVLKTYLNDDPGAFGTPLGDAERRLKLQGVAADLTAGSYGKLDLATRSAVEGQQLWARYVETGATDTMRLSDATGALADRVRAYGQSAAEAAVHAEELAKAHQGIVEASDFARGGLSSVLSGGLLSAAHGQGFTTGARSALSSFGESLLQKGVSGGINMLTGGAGNPLGFGSLFSSPAAKGGFGSYGPQLPDTGGGAGGFIGSLLGSLTGISHFAGGTQDAPGGEAIVGEGGPEKVFLPRGAQVMNADETSAMGARAGGGHTINFGDTHIHATGGGAPFTSDQIRELKGHITAGQQETIRVVTRNLPAIIRTSGGYSRS